MFERYTEGARRTIFFARYEASQSGSTEIGTEHLLLGLLREARHMFAHHLPSVSQKSLRTDLQAHITQNPPISTAVDIPLTDASKRVLVYAAEEADRLSQSHIGTEHLLLAFLRETPSHAANALGRQGLDLASLREQIAVWPEISAETVSIHRRFYSRKQIHAAAQKLRAFAWQKKDWRPVDVVVRRVDGRISFDVSLAESSSEFELKRGKWIGDTCALCHWDSPDEHEKKHNLTYTNGRQWLCTECYEQFIWPNHPNQ